SQPLPLPLSWLTGYIFTPPPPWPPLPRRGQDISRYNPVPAHLLGPRNTSLAHKGLHPGAVDAQLSSIVSCSQILDLSRHSSPSLPSCRQPFSFPGSGQPVGRAASRGSCGYARIEHLHILQSTPSGPSR